MEATWTNEENFVIYLGNLHAIDSCNNDKICNVKKCGLKLIDSADEIFHTKK